MMLTYIFILSLFYVLTSAQLTTYLTNELINEINSKATNYLKNPKILKQNYYSIQILQYSKVSNVNCNCESVKSLLDRTTNPFDIYYGIESIKECQCPSYDISNTLKDKLLKDSQRNDFNAFVGSTLALVAINYSVPSVNLVVDRLKQFHLPDGLFKNDLSDETLGSFENTLLACELLSLYSQNGQKPLFKDFIDTFMQYLPSGDDETYVEPSILTYIDRLAEKKPRLSSVRLTSTASLLLSQLYSNDLYIVSNALKSYTVTSTYKISPIVIKLEKNSFPLVEKDNFSIVINVYDLFGNNINKNVISFDVKSFKNSITNDVFYTGSIENGVLSLSDLNPTIGRYALDLSILLVDRTQPISTITYLTIYDKIELNNVYFGITDSKQVSISELQEIKRQNYLDAESYLANSFDSHVLHVIFSTNINKSNKPNQLLVQFKHKSTNTYTYFPFEYKVDKSNGKNGLTYEATIVLASEVETFLHLSGVYELTIIGSDVIYSNTINYPLGELTLKFPNKIVKDFSLYKKSLLDASDNTLEPLPEIKHVMRPPDKRASPLMSTLFAALVLIPLVVLLYSIISLKPNLKKLNSISSLVFVGLLIGVLSIYLSYWFAIKGFSFYQTIKYMCILLPITYLAGRSSIADVIEIGIKDKKIE